MEIYVRKKKKKLKDRIGKAEKFNYKLIFHEHGYYVIEEFSYEDDLLNRLRHQKLYKQDMFPLAILNEREFIEKEFSIYY